MTTVVAVTALLTIGRRSLWLDEVLTVSVAMAPTNELPSLLGLNGGNMALHYVAMHGWVQLGTSEWVLRLPSLAFGLAALVVLYRLGRRLFDRQVAVTSTALMAVNGSWIHYSQEVRGYTLALLLILLSWTALLNALEQDRGRSWISYSILVALSGYAHLLSVAFIVAQAVYVLTRRAAVNRRYVAATATAGLLLVPLAIVALGPSASPPSWIAPLNLNQLTAVVHFLAGGTSTFLVLCQLALWVAGSLILVRWMSARELVQPGRLLLSWAVVPIAVTVLISTVEPMLIGRYVFSALPAYCLLASLAITRVGQRAGNAVLAGICVLALVTTGVFAHEEENWRAAAAELARDGSPNDGVLFVPVRGRAPLEYQAMQLGHGQRTLPQPVAPSEPWKRPRRIYPSQDDGVGPKDLLDHDRIWVVLSRDAEKVRQPELNALLAAFRLTDTTVVAGDSKDIELRQYDRRSSE